MFTKLLRNYVDKRLYVLYFDQIPHKKQNRLQAVCRSDETVGLIWVLWSGPDWKTANIISRCASAERGRAAHHTVKNPRWSRRSSLTREVAVKVSPLRLRDVGQLSGSQKNMGRRTLGQQFRR